MDQALNWGAKRLILCVGYQQEKFTQAYQNSKYETAVDLVFSKEEKPLGTAGAIRNASAWIQTDPFLVLNGDSFLNLDFKAFLQFHKARASEISLAVTKVQDQKTYGSVVFDPKTFQITSFLEKNAQTKTPWINGGIYCLRKSVLESIPSQKAFSLEYDLFSKKLYKMFAYSVQKEFIDIGLPERFYQAKTLFKKVDFKRK